MRKRTTRVFIWVSVLCIFFTTAEPCHAKDKKGNATISIKHVVMRYYGRPDVYYMVRGANDVYSLTAYSHGEPFKADTFCFFKGYVYKAMLIGPATWYNDKHIVEKTDNYVVLVATGDTTHKPRQMEATGYDTSSHVLTGMQYTYDSLVNRDVCPIGQWIKIACIKNGKFDEYQGIEGHTETNYWLGYKNGSETTYDGHNNVTKVVYYRNGVLDSVSKEYFPVKENWKHNITDGKLYRLITYKNGYKDGLSETWYDNGKPEEITHYNKGEKDGEYMHWSSDSVLLEHSNYVSGELDGHYETWYDNGKKKEDGYYNLGNKNKTWKTWDKNGKLLSVKHYTSNISGIDGEMNEANSFSTDRVTATMIESYFGESQIGSLYNQWIQTKEGKPLLKCKTTFDFNITIDETGKVTWKVLADLSNKEAGSLESFFMTLPAKVQPSVLNEQPWASVYTYEVKPAEVK